MNRGEGLGARIRDHFDWPLFIVAMLIAACGVVNLYSATSVYTGARSELYINQLYWIFAGSIVGGLLLLVDYRHLERIAYPLYAFGIFTLLLVFVLAKDVRGSARWIDLGSFSFQPSEFTKLFLAIALARYFHDDTRNESRTLKDLLVPAVLTGIPTVLILRQPDLGTATIHVLIFLTVVAMTRVRWQSVLTFVGAIAVALPLIWNYGLYGYQKNRVEIFLDPEKDILGKGWHAHHSRVAIGNGGPFGNGFMQGMQNQFHFLPDQYTDFPFPVFAEEWGFVGTVVLSCLYAFLAAWSVRIASQAKDRFGAVLAIACTAITFWHAVINMGMTSGIAPVVGVTLPLFSYGGSAVTNSLLTIALLMNVSVRRNATGPRGEWIE